MLTSELTYKYIILATLAISGIIRGYYELRYMRVPLVKIYKGTREKFFVKFVGFCITGPVLIYVFFDYLNFAHINFPGILRLIAGILMLFNVFYFLWIHLTLGRNWSPILVISKDQKLITYGPYKSIRHPMYTSIWLHLFCMMFVSGNWIVGTIGILAFGTSYFIRINEEESMMIDEFGEDYINYKKKTRRLIPKLF